MAKHQRLTVRKINSLKPARPGQRYDLMDANVRGFGVRVTDKGLRTFILLARFPGFSNPTRRALGEYPTLSLEKARAKAQRWREMIAAGKDPKHEEERAKLGELRKQKNTLLQLPRNS